MEEAAQVRGHIQYLSADESGILRSGFQARASRAVSQLREAGWSSGHSADVGSFVSLSRPTRGVGWQVLEPRVNEDSASVRQMGLLVRQYRLST